jgi:hypothetical protein
VRKNKPITVFSDYDDILDKGCGAWNFFASDPDRIASITLANGVCAELVIFHRDQQFATHTLNCK